MPYKLLLPRRLPAGGFCEQPGGQYRSDATAWAVLCLGVFAAPPDLVTSAREQLCKAQCTDGSIPVTPDHPEAVWPTAVAALALAGDTRFTAARNRAIDYLLATGGTRITTEPGSPLGHDTSLQGWSWVTGTHSWVEPTAMAIRALTRIGKGGHPRVREGIRLLLDRQLPQGGWNYGNTTVYGKPLAFMPASTGMALWALAGLVDEARATDSIRLLQRHLPDLHTPLSLGWALHGLAAWNVAAPGAGSLVADCLQRQGRYADYGTSQLSVLLTAASGHNPAGTGHA